MNFTFGCITNKQAVTNFLKEFFMCYFHKSFFFILCVCVCGLVLDKSAFSTHHESNSQSSRYIFVFQATAQSYGAPGFRSLKKPRFCCCLCWLIYVCCSIYWHVCCLYLQGLRPSPAPKHTRLLMGRRARSNASSAAPLLLTASWVPLSPPRSLRTFPSSSDECGLSRLLTVTTSLASTGLVQ